MGKILFGIYALGGIACVIFAASTAWEIVKKKRQVTDQMIGAGTMAFMSFMLAFAPFMWNEIYIEDRIPDGEYRIMADVTLPDMPFAVSLPVDIQFYTDVEYSDDTYYLGGVEMDSTKTTARIDILLERIYWTDGTVLADPYCEILANKDEEIWLEDGDITVNTGVLTQETLGIARADIVQNLSVMAKAEPIAICVSCAFCIWQYFKSRKDHD